ncbi:MAG TPA: hypothetical protein ENG74_03040, partial [Thermoplasmatales archaeon]|nr:hypothetical protein [Thermoplasmatales archaeon]
MRGNLAQLNVLEAIVAIGIVFLAVSFTYQQLQTPAVHLDIPTSIKLRNLCEEILHTLWETPPDNSEYSGKLAELIALNKTAELCAEINKSLPPNVFYNLWLYDGVARYLLYPMNGQPNEGVGDVVVAHQIFILNGTAYS